MDLQRLRRNAVSGSSTLVDLPEYIITTFFPAAQPLLAQYPQFFRFLGVLLAVYYIGPFARLQALWSRFSSILIATVSVASEEDLFGYLSTYIAERKTLRLDQSLNAISNPVQENRRMRREPEESAKQPQETPKIKYEQGQGMQIFFHKKRIFFVKRENGEGHTYVGNRTKRSEILSLSCLGRSTKPIKELIEDVYYMHKDKERTLTIIRRPYMSGMGGRLNWSRLTSKPRRALDTVILEAAQKAQVIDDMEEYMKESTQAFYANHGIPYRRGYLFHGPPGVGKSSFSLALASKFNLDVYVLTLLDHDLTDSDLTSLLNQLPSRSLLLLEDIDTAGLSRKNKAAITARLDRRRMPRMRGMQGASMAENKKDTVDDEEESAGTTSNVSLSGLLNAIDGVAAPEGHILIMTTNKPHELDEALVRAGRISVRVEFKNASKVQAEEIFRRMYVDAPAVDKTKLNSEESPSSPTEKQSSDLPELARQFAQAIPDYEFSPADLQDYLLVNKKDPVKAVKGLEEWMEEKREDMKRREEEKEAERELKREKKDLERKMFRDEIRSAMKGDDDEQQEKEEKEGKQGKGDDEKKEAREEK